MPRGGKRTKRKRPDGYIVSDVGPDHHLVSPAAGFALEHRVVAEAKIGRRLMPGEVVHHINGDRSDNRPENLEVFENNAAHMHAHSKTPEKWMTPGSINPIVVCACGCGTEMEEYNSHGKRRRYIHNHHWRGKHRYGWRGSMMRPT